MKSLLPFALASLLLGGCAPTVHSIQPIFGPADAKTEPVLRPGIWVFDAEHGKCRPKPRQPVSRWKSCTLWILVRDGDIAMRDGKAGWTTTPYLIASGAPAIWQLGPEADEAGPRYTYYGLKPSQAGADGRLARFTTWGALCGTVQPKKALAKAGAEPLKAQSAKVTLLPGLAFAENNWDCVASDRDTIRGAAVFGAAHPEWSPVFEARWVREVRPDDFTAR